MSADSIRQEENYQGRMRASTDSSPLLPFVTLKKSQLFCSLRRCPARHVPPDGQSKHWFWPRLKENWLVGQELQAVAPSAEKYLPISQSWLREHTKFSNKAPQHS
jgi:hypothetical protein